MKVLVTGGAGYIGSHVVLELIEKDHEVLILDDLTSGNRNNISSEATFIEGSTLDENILNSCLSAKIDAVIHLAASKGAGESMLLPEKYSRNNIIGTLNLLNAMIKNKIEIIVFSSSASVYGFPKYLPLDEKHPTEPINYYGYTKLAIEQHLQWYSTLKGLNFVSLRYFNAAGYDKKGRIIGLEKNPANLLPIVMEVANKVRSELKIFGNNYNTDDGTGVRDYIHVTDLASAHFKALNYLQKRKNLTLNLSSGKGYSVLNIVEKTKEVTGMDIPYRIVNRRPGDPDSLIANPKLAQEILNWIPENTKLNHLLESMRNIYKNN